MQHLVVDTSLFSATFQAKLLSALSAELSDGLDKHINGILIHSDNFQALNLLQARYHEQVKCIYIDPPYNTGDDGFIYKDNFQSSSWISMFENRLNLAKYLLNDEGLLGCHIDEHEHLALEYLIQQAFDDGDLGKLIWDKRNPKGLVKGLASQHEYIHFATKNLEHLKQKNAFSRDKPNAEMMLLTVENLIKKYGVSDNAREEYKKWLTKNSSLLSGGEKAYKFIDEDGNIYRTVSMAAPDKPETRSHRPLRHPVTGKPCPVPAKGWRFKDDVMDNLLKNNRIIFGEDDTTQPQNKYLLKENLSEIVPSIYYMGGSDDDFFKNVLLSFPNPKPLKTALYCIQAMARPKNSLVMDYFGGSGTTAHAVINLNREDNGKRQYILVEQGEYFDTVLKPRVQKVIYSKAWKDGKPVVEDKADNLQGVPQIVKVLKLESYEDTLNNLELRRSDLFDQLPKSAQHDYLLHYMLDIESRDSLLNVSHFAKPFDYQLKITTNSAGEFDKKTIDLVETFNYLIGATVIGIDDKRDEQGFVVVECHLPNQHTDEKTLIFWRDCERIGYDGLQKQFDLFRISPADSEYSQVYVNGDHTLETVWDGEQSGSLKIRSIEAEFLALMFVGDE